MERIPNGRLFAPCVAAGLTAVAATLFARRVAVESLRDVPPGEAALYAALFATAAAATARAASAGARPSLSKFGDGAALFATLAFAAGLTASPVGVLVCLSSAAAAAWALVLRPRHEPAADVATDTGEAVSAAAEPAEGEDQGEAVTRLCRSVRDGREVLEGGLRFEVPAGEDAHVLHVPVWPPLAGDPAVTCELHEIEGRVRVPLAKAHGFRIEVRLPEAVDEPLEGLVRFVAECPAESAAA